MMAKVHTLTLNLAWLGELGVGGWVKNMAGTGAQMVDLISQPAAARLI